MERKRFTVEQMIRMRRGRQRLICPRAGAPSLACRRFEEIAVAESPRVALRFLACALLTFSRIQTDLLTLLGRPMSSGTQGPPVQIQSSRPDKSQGNQEVMLVLYDILTISF
jgi:hypothetical protein